MKFLKLICFSCILVLSFAILINAQTPSTKIGLINRKDFDDITNGIKEVSDAYDELEIEFKPHNEELKAIAEKLKKLEIALIDLKKQTQIIQEKGGEYPKGIEDKINEYEQLACKFKSAEQKTKSIYEKREAEILKDVNLKISEALKQFAKKNGFAVILDKSVNNSSVIIDGEIVDITQDFINYYNKNFAETKTQ